MKKLEKKVALITAATQGIGFASAMKLAQQGAKICIASLDDDYADEAIKKLRSEGFSADFFKFSASEYEAYAGIISDIIKKEHRIDILVNNFGMGMPSKDLDVVNGDPYAFFDILHMNIGSVYFLCKLIIPHMIKNGGGNIVNISSVGGIYPDTTRTAYGLSKNAVNYLTQMIAMQYAKNNIRCNAVAPGMIGTAAVKNNMTDDFQESFLNRVPLHRMGSPEDIANAVLFFASEDSSFITGSIQQVGGGYGISDPNAII